MTSSVQHKKNKLLVVLFPDKKPIRLNVTFPCTAIWIILQFVRLVFWWKATRIT